MPTQLSQKSCSTSYNGNTRGLGFLPIRNGTALSVGVADKYKIQGKVLTPDQIGELPVMEIAKEGFRECDNITSIIIPNNIDTIGEGAFFDCSDLYRIHIPHSIVDIPFNMLNSCTSLVQLDIPQHLDSIGMGAFTDCINIAQLNIPNSVTFIGGYAFGVSPGMTPIFVSVVIPDSVVTIEKDAFMGQTIYVSHTTIPDGWANNRYDMEGMWAVSCVMFTGCTLEYDQDQMPYVKQIDVNYPSIENNFTNTEDTGIFISYSRILSPTRVGHQFVGWSTDPDGSSLMLKPSNVQIEIKPFKEIYRNISIFATTEEIYTIPQNTTLYSVQRTSNIRY